jgi:hypothetical protein
MVLPLLLVLLLGCCLLTSTGPLSPNSAEYQYAALHLYDPPSLHHNNKNRKKEKRKPVQQENRSYTQPQTGAQAATLGNQKPAA